MIKILKHLKPYIFLLIFLIVLIFISVAATLQLPDYMAIIINQGIINHNNDLIVHTGLIMLVIAMAGAVATVGIGYLASRIATGFSRDVREEVFSKVESFSLKEFNQFSTASLITRSTNDVQQIQMVLVMLLRMVLQAPIMGIWAIFKAYQLAPSMSWIIALAVAVLVGFIVVFFSIALPKFTILQRLVDKLNLVTRQNLTGLRVIRAFSNEKFEEGKFDQANIDLTAANLFVNRFMVIMQPMMMLIFNLTAVYIIWIGAHLIGTQNLAIGNMIAFMQYAMQVIMSFLMVSIIFIMLPRASVSAKRVMEVISTEPAIKDPVKPAVFDSGHNHTVEFRDVTFIYPEADSPALQNISFTAVPGEITAFIGSTGSGKSTLVNLIPRFYDVTEGQVSIGGVDVRDLPLEKLYSLIGYVPQKSVLFSGTIESNIKYGAPHAKKEEAIKAAEISQSLEFIDKLEDKFASPIAQGGANISGGQKQRLSIARAIAREPMVYVFDDSFSALDFKTDADLRLALSVNIKDKTMLIVAQRISTILAADKIIVLNKGRIVGMGKHEELMATCQVYREIAHSQLSEEELTAYRIKKDNIIDAADRPATEGGAV